MRDLTFRLQVTLPFGRWTVAIQEVLARRKAQKINTELGLNIEPGFVDAVAEAFVLARRCGSKLDLKKVLIGYQRSGQYEWEKANMKRFISEGV